MRRFVSSLKFQIGLGIILITALFATSTLYSLYVIDLQHSDDVLVRLAGRLQLHEQHLTVQAMRYQENAPRDYPSYYRDLNLYFVDLQKTRDELTAIIEAFASDRFDRSVTGEHMAMEPQLPAPTRAVAEELGRRWHTFLAGLDERIGPDQGEPRLEWGAEWIVEHHAPLEQAARELMASLDGEVGARARKANLVNRLLLAAALVVSLATTIWFYRRVVSPLAIAVSGFRQVANGDFAHRVPVTHDNEIGSLASSFNHLSGRLDALRRLLTRLEHGATLEDTLRTLSETLPALIPVDWIGVLVIGVDGRIHLEQAFSDGKKAAIPRLSFEPDRTLLEECINSREPLHIADVREMGRLSENYLFLRQLAELGRRDAIFLPIGYGSSIQGVAVFANRYPNSYRAEHLALLGNLGVLVGISLARTIQLVENTRLASIGQFASGIVHEIRSPLATIGLALDYLRQADDLPPNAAKRVELATGEIGRLERLLADILLYAKPLTLDRQPTDLAALVREVAGLGGTEHTAAVMELAACNDVPLDRDRVRQVLLNLIANAREGSRTDQPIKIVCGRDANWATVEIHNSGEPIEPKALERLFEPFFTTKSSGTGLGLSIVRRIVNAHGGEISIESDTTGTVATLRLPANNPVSALVT
ncbi:MAG: HAMP domain-containing protein [Gammaproteobacteria bacterium]|nr:HAMP domain-containing protein [Gammaproteobacteria bacterium]